MPRGYGSHRWVKGSANMLEAPGWGAYVRSTLQEWLIKGAGKHLPVVFDFDNTLICGDIGEATLAVLARSGLLTPATIPPTICPPFHVPGAPGLMSLSACSDITEYYEAFLSPTAHDDRDPTPLANGYAWVVEIMENLRPLDVVEATKKAFEWTDPAKPGFIEVTQGKTAFPVPFFYPEMVGLLAELVRLEYDVWVISASNVWSVRWMVLQALNPLLHRRGLRQGLRADHVIGISTLLSDRRGRLYKDALLVKEHPGYAALDPKALGGLRLTSRLQFPVPTYSGKVACALDAIGGAVYLAAGDSPGDLALLSQSRHRLWISRLEKPAYQKTAWEFMNRTGRSGWIVQPVLAREQPGFLANLDEVSHRLPRIPVGVRASMQLWAADVA